MDIKELLNKTDRFAAANGCQITEADEQHAVAVMTVSTLADLAIAALMNFSGRLTFGISNSIMFVSSAREGDILRAEAVFVGDHHKIPSVEVRVTNQDGVLICHVTGMGYRKSVAINT